MKAKVELQKQVLQERDTMLALAVTAVIAATLKFLTEGVSIDVAGKCFSLGHVDSMTYGAFLAPILGAHSFIKTRPKKEVPVDNPDKV